MKFHKSLEIFLSLGLTVATATMVAASELHSWGASMLRGQLAFKHGEYSAAHQHFSKAMVLCRNKTCLQRICRRYLAKSLCQSHRWAEAAKLYGKDLSDSYAVAGDMVESLAGLANVDVELGKFDEAERLLYEARSISRGPLCVEAYVPTAADIDISLIRLYRKQNCWTKVESVVADLRQDLFRLPFKLAVYATLQSVNALHQITGLKPEMAKRLQNECISLCEEVQKHFLSVKEPFYQASLLKCLSEELIDGQPVRSLELIDRALALTGPTMDSGATVRLRIVKSMIDKQFLPLAAELLHKLSNLTLAGRTEGTRNSIVTLQSELATDLLNEKQYEQAVDVLRESLQEAKKAPAELEGEICSELSTYAIALERLGRTTEAVTALVRLRSRIARIKNARRLVAISNLIILGSGNEFRKTGILVATRALSLESHNAAARMCLANFFLLSEDFKYAAHEYTTALQDHAPRAECLLRRATCEANSNSYEQAIKDITESIRLTSEPVLGLKIRADIHRRFRHFDESIADYDEALRLAPKQADLFCVRGLIKHQQGKTVEALKDLTQALNLGSRDSFCRAGLGDISASNRQYPQAIAHYEAGISLDAKNPANYRGLGNVYSLQDRHEEALKLLNQAVLLAPADPCILADRDRAGARAGRAGDQRGAPADREMLAPTTSGSK